MCCRAAQAGDPAALAESHETIRLAFVAALQHLPPRQRAALILCEVLHWKAAEVAELLDTSVAAVNSSLQRARATLDSADIADPAAARSQSTTSALLGRYVDAFQRYDMDALTSLIHEDATQSMPPYELWLRGREDIFAWWVGKGAACRGSRVIADTDGQRLAGVRPVQAARGRRRGLRTVGAAGARDRRRQIVEMTFFLSTETIFPLFGVPLQYAGQPREPALERRARRQRVPRRASHWSSRAARRRARRRRSAPAARRGAAQHAPSSALRRAASARRASASSATASASMPADLAAAAARSRLTPAARTCARTAPAAPRAAAERGSRC